MSDPSGGFDGNAPPGRRKRILIDASTLSPTVDGLSVYIINLIKNLPADASREFDFTVLLNPGVEWPDLETAMQDRQMRVIREKVAPIGPRRDWDMLRFLRRHRGKFDLVHITSNNYPLALKGGIATIHDVTFKRWFAMKDGLPGAATAARVYMTVVIQRCLRRAEALIAVSGSTREELNQLFSPKPLDRAKIKVIHEGWEHLRDYEGDCEPFSFEGDGYLFFLGSYRIHKNLTNLLKGFLLTAGRIPENKRLVISGTSGELSDKHRQLILQINAERERVLFTGYVASACVRRLYRKADAFVFPSLAEGFGLPVLEAFHCGTPLLCARATSLPEVAGDAAVYFDPSDPADIAEAIVRFYADPSLAAELRAKGERRLELFSWTKTANQTVELYHSCLSAQRQSQANRVPGLRIRVASRIARAVSGRWGRTPSE